MFDYTVMLLNWNIEPDITSGFSLHNIPIGFHGAIFSMNVDINGCGTALQYVRFRTVVHIDEYLAELGTVNSHVAVVTDIDVAS